MADRSKIENVSASLNLWWGCYGANGTRERPVRCSYCYAHTLAKRKLRHCELCQQFVPHFHEEKLQLPLKWRKPRIVFVESMGDIASEGVEFEWFVRIMTLIHKARRHIYLMLTKRPVQLNDLLKRYAWMVTPRFSEETISIAKEFPHLWVGVTITGYRDRWRLDVLGRMNVAHRFVSYEPMLNAPPLIFPLQYDLEGYVGPKPVEWVIMGAQTGAGAKRPDYLWVKDVVAQCKAHNVPLFIKKSLHLGPGMRQFPPEMQGLKR